MVSLAVLILQIISIYIYIIIATIVISWLIGFNVLNTRNRFVSVVNDFLQRITEPALAPIRRFVPLIGGIDISPVVLILLLVFAQNLIREYWLFAI